MLDRLEGAAERQRRFVADASHELRTPVATLRTELEVAQLAGDEASLRGGGGRRAGGGGPPRGPPRRSAAAGIARRGAGHRRRARSTSAALPLAEAERPRRLPVSVTGAGSATGNQRQLERVVRNLLDNAARHATSTVAVTVDGARLVVEDDGPGIAEADRDRIFERFTRLDEGRARDDGGSGLGLSIVRAVVEAHGGRVQVDGSPHLGGARFTVDLAQ